MRIHRTALVLGVLCCLLLAPVAGVAIASPPTTTSTPNNASATTTGTTPAAPTTAANSSNQPTDNLTRPAHPPNARNWTAPQDRSVAATTETDVKRIVVFAGQLTETRRDHLSNQSLTVGAVGDGRAVVSGPQAALHRLVELPWITRIEQPRRPQPMAVSEGVESIESDALHAANVTGENVTVGVIDLGFDLSNPEIADSIVAAQAFDGDPWRGKHGTAVTEIVTDVAPGADVAVAQIDNRVEYERALEWLTETQDVDVITVSLGFYGQPNDGSSPISKMTTRAVESGTVVTVASGNTAQRHWEGQASDSDGDDWVEYNGSAEANFLNEGATTGGQVSLYLTWEDWPTTTQDYNLYLYRVTDSGPELAAASTYSQATGGQPLEFIQTTIAAGQYFVVVEAHSGINADAPSAELFCAGDGCGAGLSQKTPAGSITAPAVAPGVIGVGAYNVHTGALEPYSSRGPDNNGDRGVDVLGPARVTTSAYDGSFIGTSAAAPHVAGAATLAIQADRAATAAMIADRIERGATAVDAPPGAAGAGRVSAMGAVRAGIPPLNVSVQTNETAPYRTNTSITFAATDGVTRATSIAWDFDGDGVTDANGTEVTHRFATSGTHTVTTTVTDVYGSTVATNTTLQTFSPETLPTTMSVVPDRQIIPVNTTTDVVIEYDAGFGVGRFDAVLASPDARNLSLGPVTAPANATVNATRANETIHLHGTVARAEAENATLATVSVRGTGVAKNVSLALRNVSATTADGVSYGRIERRNALLSIISGPGDVTGDGSPATDPNDDGVYEDVNGDGSVNLLDVQALFANQKAVRGVLAFDFNRDGDVNILDVQALFARL